MATLAPDTLVGGPHGRSTALDSIPSEAVERRPFVRLNGIRAMLSGTPVLVDASLSIFPAEILGLCGDNGAGKSTLVQVLAGVHGYGCYNGTIIVDDTEQRFSGPNDARALGISLVQKTLTLVPELSVAQNLLLGREPRRFGLVDEARLESDAGAALCHFGLATVVDPVALVADLTFAARQMVEVLRALLQGARLVILDEPTATLAASERDRLLAWLRTLKTLGVSILYVSHRAEEVFELCDRITILRAGKTAQTVHGSPAPQRRVRGRYAVYEEIAAGGMATVHLGKTLGSFGFTNAVAIKRLHPQMAKDPEFLAMLFDEARLASRVRHPNVVRVLDVFAESGDLCLVMEYVEGESLAQLFRAASQRQEAIPVSIVGAVVTSVLRGLHAAHCATDEQGHPLGLVHRDVSPQNVIVGLDGVTRIIDFGIAKAAGRCSVSRDDQLKGKIPYMAPEQIQRGQVSERTDVYGASVILWELLTGERLFDGQTQGVILGRVLDDPVTAPSQLCLELPPALDFVTLRGLNRNPERRFESALEMAEALEAAAGTASAAEVGQWVQRLAGPALAERHAKLTRMERDVD